MKLFGKRKHYKTLRSYPCDVFLHNALRYINEGKSNLAYEEICYAITKSGGALSDNERKKLHEIQKAIRGEE